MARKYWNQRLEIRLPEAATQKDFSDPMPNDIYTRSRDTGIKGRSGYHSNPVLPEQKYSGDFIKTSGKLTAAIRHDVS